MTDNRPSLAVFLWRAVLWFDDGLQQNLRARGLFTTTRTQSQVISNLSLGDARPTGLARNIGVSSQAMSQILADMVKEGVVTIVKDATDGRARVVRLTDFGATYLATVRQIFAGMELIWETKFDRSVIDLLRMVFHTHWGADEIPPEIGVKREDAVAGGHASLVVYLWRAMRWFDDHLQSKLQEWDMFSTSRSQSQVIANLVVGETRPTRLARNIGISPQAMSQLLTELGQADLVAVVRDETDGRARIVELTATGQDYLARVRTTLLGLEKELEDRFGRAVIDVVRMVLQTDWNALGAPIIPDQMLMAAQ